MTNQRSTIRAAMASFLEAAAIVPAGKVFVDRALAVAAEDLPVIIVEWVPPETSAYRDLSTTVLTRNLDLQVELVASNLDETLVADAVDAYAGDIEAALSDSSWEGTVVDQHLTATDYEKDVHGEVPVGRLKLKYSAKYFA